MSGFSAVKNLIYRSSNNFRKLILKYFSNFSTLNSLKEMSAVNMSTLTREDIKAFLNSFDTVLTDCDGVTWLDDRPLKGASATLQQLRDLGKKVFYVTNNSTKTRDEFVTKCSNLGFKASADEIISTAYLTACYMSDLGFKKKAYIVGSTGLTRELDSVGIRHSDIGPDPLRSSLAAFVNQEFHRDPEVGAVVVGFDEHFNYIKMLRAATYLNDPDCIFIATNTDERFPMRSDLVVPGTGSIVAAVEACAGRPAFKIGKPSSYIRDVIVKRHNVDPKRTLMIGDRGNTDILLGTRCGFQTLLVLTGVSSLEDVNEWKKSDNKDIRGCVPDYYLESLGDLLPLIS
ncbi:glycerol-3-phosphate phosphatase [Anabrus simplex]|uniref:glycerol-3-phosphate phosphatase n=1 Tax=Anabrus simplex TaxID=316456 RepID=UPI0035A3B3DE